MAVLLHAKTHPVLNIIFAGYGGESISFFEALLRTGMVRQQDMWWAQAGDRVSPYNVMQGLEPGLRKLLEEQSYRNMKVRALTVAAQEDLSRWVAF